MNNKLFILALFVFGGVFASCAMDRSGKDNGHWRAAYTKRPASNRQICSSRALTRQALRILRTHDRLAQKAYARELAQQWFLNWTQRRAR